MLVTKSNTTSLIVLLSALALGCSSEPKRVPVSGTVNLDGKPVSNCILVLQSDSSEFGAGATAVVQEGKFSMTNETGPIPGKYFVLVQEDQPDLEEYEERKKVNPKNALNKKFVPDRYRSRSDLKVAVSASVDPLVINLSSKRR
ncbi:MAG: hypothetical protein ACK5YR_00130 [Pirellula sp.]|jgi:hypothetical protein